MGESCVNLGETERLGWGVNYGRKKKRRKKSPEGLERNIPGGVIW